MYRITGLILSLLFISACGGGGSGGDDTVVAEARPAAAESAQANPIAQSTEFFGQDGNLYKPFSDPTGAGQGNLVVLLSSKFTKRFNSCEVRLNTGETAQLLCIDTEEWTQTPFSCFSNGNRQTWRANFRCSSMAEIKVTCFDTNQEVVFTVPEAQRGNVCTRYG